jgi:TrkA domain protein
LDVTEILLPGVGLRYEFTTTDGDRIGVVARRSGQFEFVGFRGDDPDEPVPLFRLDREEADTVTEILGAPRIAERFADLTREVPGLSAGQIAITAGSRYAGRPLGDTRARSLTGASIVAIVRGDGVVPSPGPAEPLGAGDVLIVIGTHEGIAAVQRLLES